MRVARCLLLLLLLLLLRLLLLLKMLHPLKLGPLAPVAGPIRLAVVALDVNCVRRSSPAWPRHDLRRTSCCWRRSGTGSRRTCCSSSSGRRRGQIRLVDVALAPDLLVVALEDAVYAQDGVLVSVL